MCVNLAMLIEKVKMFFITGQKDLCDTSTVVQHTLGKIALRLKF